MTHLADSDRFDNMLASLDAGRVSGHEKPQRLGSRRCGLKREPPTSIRTNAKIITSARMLPMEIPAHLR